MKHHLGPLIRQIRLARGIGVNELGRILGMKDTGSNLSRFERELKNSLRAPECLYPIAKALDTSVPVLFLLHEKCLMHPEILENPASLLAHLNYMNSEIERLAA
jgi:transcriptional regulator with XRE-family HTH domain